MLSPLPGSIHGTSTFELLAALGRDWTASPQPAGAAPNLNSSRRGQPMASVHLVCGLLFPVMNGVSVVVLTGRAA